MAGVDVEVEAEPEYTQTQNFQYCLLQLVPNAREKVMDALWHEVLLTAFPREERYIVTVQANPTDRSKKLADIMVRRYNEEMTAERTVLFVENKKVEYEGNRRKWKGAEGKLIRYMNEYKSTGHDERTVGLVNVGRLTRFVKLGEVLECKITQGYGGLPDGTIFHVVRDAAKI